MFFSLTQSQLVIDSDSVLTNPIEKKLEGQPMKTKLAPAAIKSILYLHILVICLVQHQLLVF